MRRSLKQTKRLLLIGWTLARHDAFLVPDELRVAPVLRLIGRLCGGKCKGQRKGQRLARAFETLGPTFIKLGQALSIRPDLVGQAVADDLADLRDKLPPFSTKQAKDIIESEFERPLNELFASFDEMPVAAASIAQVHFAKTLEGDEVAVKVLRPDVEQAFARDIELLLWLAEQFEARVPKYKRLKPVETVQEFAKTVDLELDLRYEAAAAMELRDNLPADGGFYVPEVYWQHTAQRVLTTQRISGISLNDMAAIDAAGVDKRKLVEIAAVAFFSQVFKDGFFHADLHPGNIFVLPDNRLAVVDFGIMGRVDRATQLYLAEMLWAFLNEEYERVAKVHIRAGFVPKDTSVKAFAQANRAIAKPIFGKPLNEISIAKLLSQLFRVAETFQMETQPQLLMLQKTMMLAEGMGRMLDPTVNMWKLAEPMINDWARKEMSPKARVKDTLEEGVQMMQRLPQLVSRAEAVLDDMQCKGSPQPVKTRKLGVAGWLGWLAAIGVAVSWYSAS